ncbi:hypothetical protein D3C80_1616450 [compost metagenome]
MCGLLEVVRHLDRQAATGRELGHQRWQQRGVVRQPLEHRVGEDHIKWARLVPGRDIRGVEAHTRQALAGGLDHVGRTVDTTDRGIGKTLYQQLGGVTGAATDVDHRTRIQVGDRSQQITRRARALIFEGHVLFSRPAHRILL